MRAQSKAQSAPLPASVARSHLRRVAVAVVATILLLFIWHPLVLTAQSAPIQDTATVRHDVKAGETLWSIATRYYGDGHAWRAIARRNGIPLAGDAVIHVGMALSIPTRATVASAASAAAKLPAPEDTVTPAFVTAPAAAADSAMLARRAAAYSATAAASASGGSTGTGSLAAQTRGKANAGATGVAASGASSTGKLTVASGRDRNAIQDTTPLAGPSGLRPQVIPARMLVRSPARLGFLDATDARDARKPSDVPTVFIRQSLNADEAAAAAREALKPRPPAPRHGEYHSAPYPVPDTHWGSSGRIVRRIDAGGPAQSEMLRLQLADEVEIELPGGVTASVGSRWLVVRKGILIAPGVQMALPTGIVQVTAANPGQPVRAYVRSQTGVIDVQQVLFPIVGAAARADLSLTRLQDPDIRTQISWIEDGTLLPSVLNFLLLSAGASEGVQAGDEFEIVGDADSEGLTRIAVVRVVRVGEFGSTAVVIRQSRSGIAVGARAQRSSRMP